MRILYLQLSDEDAGPLIESLGSLDRGRYVPIVLAATPGLVFDAETHFRPLCACFASAGGKVPWAKLLLRPGILLALFRYCRYVRSFARDHRIDAVCALSPKARFIARLVRLPLFDPAIKVALFTDSDVFAGTERHMLDLARGLRSAGVSAAIACPALSPLAKRAQGEGLRVIPVEKRGNVDISAIATLRKHLRSGQINLIHSHNGRTALSAALAAKLERRGRYILTQHFLTPCRSTRRGPKAALSSAVHRWISRGAGHVIAISDAARLGIEARRETANDNLSTVPNGLSAPDSSKLATPSEVRANLGISPAQPLIVCAARLEDEKDIRSLVAAMPAVLAASPNAVCVIAGEGSQRDALAAQIAALALRDSVRLPGFCADAMSLINAADLFVLPSLAEPFGLVLIEAMSLGKPVIATRAGGPREIVEEGATGLLVPPSDPAALAAAIIRLLLDEPLRLALGAQGHDRFLQNYTLSRMTAATLEIYREVLGQSASPAPIPRPKPRAARAKPRVLLISHTCQSRTEGQPRAEELARAGDIDLMVLAPRRFNHFGAWRNAEIPDNPSFDFVARHVVWPWLGPAQNYLHWYPSLAGILRSFRPDIIDLWQEPWSLVSAQACWLRNQLLPDARIVMETEQNIFKAWPPPFRWLESFTMRNATFAVGRSAGALEVLRAKGYAGPARVIGNAADTSLFRPMDRSGCKRALGLSGFTVGYVGRLVERKGLTDMVDALRLCTGEITMVFAGEGELQSALQQRARALGVEERIRFIPARPLRDLPPVMNALDALILPSWTVPTWKEQFGRVIIEAHACEIPVIGSDSGAIPGVVGEGGLIYPERNPAALAAAIVELRANPSRSREMGAAGRRQVDANYTWRQVAAQMRDVYFQCLDSAPEPAAAHAPSLIPCP